MDPDEVLSGAGTAALGGRFAPVDTLAVYLSATDTGTGTELLARKARLGGSPQITLDRYPRVVFGVQVELSRVIDLWVDLSKRHKSLIGFERLRPEANQMRFGN